MALTNKEVKELESLLRRAQELIGKAGVPVAKVAAKHGISPAYIYQID